MRESLKANNKLKRVKQWSEVWTEACLLFSLYYYLLLGLFQWLPSQTIKLMASLKDPRWLDSWVLCRLPPIDNRRLGLKKALPRIHHHQAKNPQASTLSISRSKDSKIENHKLKEVKERNGTSEESGSTVLFPTNIFYGFCLTELYGSFLLLSRATNQWRECLSYIVLNEFTFSSFS